MEDLVIGVFPGCARFRCHWISEHGPREAWRRHGATLIRSEPNAEIKSCSRQGGQQSAKPKTAVQRPEIYFISIFAALAALPFNSTTITSIPASPVFSGMWIVLAEY